MHGLASAEKVYVFAVAGKMHLNQFLFDAVFCARMLLFVTRTRHNDNVACNKHLADIRSLLTPFVGCQIAVFPPNGCKREACLLSPRPLSSDALKCLTTGEHKNASHAAKSKDTRKAKRANKST